MVVRSRTFLPLFLFSVPFWAQSPAAPGIGNFHQVDQNVYRGAQPTNAGFDYLHSLGVKLVIDLREHDQRSAAEQRAVTAAGMQYLNVPMTGLTPPTAEETSKILALLEDGSAGPVFVHCKRGADRTGAVIAAYRIDHDNWDNPRALAEAVQNHMSRFQFERRKFISTYHGKSASAAASAGAASAPSAASAKN